MPPDTGRMVEPVGQIEATQAALREVRYALEALQADFDGQGSGPSGLRAQAMAHLKKALLWAHRD